MGVFCRGDWTDVGELGGECAGESEGGEDWTGELVYLVRVCKRVFSPGLDSMSLARSWRSSSHAAESHDWLPQNTGGPERQDKVDTICTVPLDCGTPTRHRLYPFGASTSAQLLHLCRL